MKKLVAAVLIILLLPGVITINSRVKSEQSQGKYVMHRVEQGESLSVIAEKYKGKYEKTRNVITEIKVQNQLVADDIQAGRVLVIRNRK